MTSAFTVRRTSPHLPAASRARRIRRAPYALVIVALVATTPADAQSLAESFRQLKDSVRQLGGRRADPVEITSANQQEGAAQKPSDAASDGTDLVPAVALVEDASDTALEHVPIIRRRVESFDILGFKLAMSPREVNRIARRQGIRRQWNTIYTVTGSFELEATRLANVQLNDAITKRSRNYVRNTGGLTRDGSSILFTFTLEPAGPKLSQIDYKAKRDGMDEDQLLASMERKYGPRDAKTSDLIWSNGAATIKAQDTGAKMLVIRGGTTVDMTLRASNDYVAAARRRLENRALEIAQLRGRGVKF